MLNHLHQELVLVQNHFFFSPHSSRPGAPRIVQKLGRSSPTSFAVNGTGLRPKPPISVLSGDTSFVPPGPNANTGEGFLPPGVSAGPSIGDPPLAVAPKPGSRPGAASSGGPATPGPAGAGPPAATNTVPLGSGAVTPVELAQAVAGVERDTLQAAAPRLPEDSTDMIKTSNPNDKLNLLTWHPEITTDACDPLVMWKVRKALIGVKWHLLALRDPSARPSKNGEEYFSDKIVNMIEDMEKRVMSWGHSYDPYPVPKCARDAYWNKLQNEVMHLRKLLLKQFAYAVQTKDRPPGSAGEIKSGQVSDELKSYQEFLFQNFASQMSGSAGEDASFAAAGSMSSNTSGAGSSQAGVADTAKALVQGQFLEPAYLLSDVFDSILGTKKPIPRLESGRPAFLPGPRARPKPMKEDDNQFAYLTLDDINTMERYLGELWDTIVAVPRHGEMELMSPGFFTSSLLSSAGKSVTDAVTKSLGIGPLPPGESLITLKAGQRLVQNGMVKRLGNFLV